MRVNGLRGMLWTIDKSVEMVLLLLNLRKSEMDTTWGPAFLMCVLSRRWRFVYVVQSEGDVYNFLNFNK